MMRSAAYNRFGVLMGTSSRASSPRWLSLRGNSLLMITLISSQGDFCATAVYDYVIAVVGSARGVISVEREHLTVRTGNEIATLIDLNHGQGHITHPDGTIAFAPPGPAHSALEFSVPGWEGT